MRIKIEVLIIATIIIVLSACSYNNTDISDIKLVNLKTGEQKNIEVIGESSAVILEAIDKSKKIDCENLTPEFKITISYKNGESNIYYFDFNCENQNTYIIGDNGVYEVKEYVSKKFYLNDDFAGIYVNDTKPEVSVEQNDENISLCSQYAWTYRKVNNSYVEQEGNIEGKDNIIKITDKDNFSIEFELVPDNYIIKLYENNEVVKTAKTFEDIFSDITKDGQYYIELVAEWNKKLTKNYYGIQSYSFIADIDLPAELTILSKDNYPGNVLAVFVKNTNENDTIDIICTAVNEKIDAYSYEKGIISIMPLSLDTVPGQYEVICTINKGTLNENKLSQVFTVNEKKFKTQYLEVSKTIDEETRTEEANKEYAEYVKVARTVSVPEKLWDGKFIMPVEGKLTTDFAEIRYVNDEKTSTRHSGIDIATSKGTPIKASNTGKVTLARYMILTGNTVVIDHGMGVFTTYYHLESLNVEAGDIVEKGQYIGTVGSTGFSTGPHLHFTFSIYNNYVNPYQAITGLFE